MKKQIVLLTGLLVFGVSSVSAASINFVDGITNVEDASGPTWALGSAMFNDIIADYGGNVNGVSGATGSSQVGLDLFDPGGGGLDITLLTWEFGTMSLQGVGVGDSVTQSPGAATPGYEDYRYDDNGGVAAKNLTFYYNGAEWASGYITRFVTTVPNISTGNATGEGTAYLDANTAAGQDFFDDLMTLSGGTGAMTFQADTFFSVTAADPGTFGSTGSITITAAVPEPSFWALFMGTITLGCLMIRRRRVG